MDKEAIITARVPAEIKDASEKLAAKRMLTLSALVRNLLIRECRRAGLISEQETA